MRKLKRLSLPALSFILAGLLLAGTVFVFTRPAAATGAACPAPPVPVEKPVILNGQEFILGSGRGATANKHLYIVDLQAGGKVINRGRPGQVDTDPVWTAAPPYGVIFCRGPETAA